MNVFVQIHVLSMLYEANRGFLTPPPAVATSQQTSGLLKCPWTRHWSPTSCRAAVQSLKLASDVPQQGQTKTKGINQYKGTQTSLGCLRPDSGSYCITMGSSEPDSHHTHHTHTCMPNAAMSLMISLGKVSSTLWCYDTSERASLKSSAQSLPSLSAHTVHE